MITVHTQSTCRTWLTHVRIEPFSRGLTVKRGYFYNGEFCSREVEHLYFKDHEELRTLFDGNSWDVSALQAFIEESVPEFDRPELTTTKATH